MNIETKQPVIISGKRHEKGVQLNVERVIAKKLIKENKVKSLESKGSILDIFSGKKKDKEEKQYKSN